MDLRDDKLQLFLDIRRALWQASANFAYLVYPFNVVKFQRLLLALIF